MTHNSQFVMILHLNKLLIEERCDVYYSYKDCVSD